jgi:branched-chain amino acid transport system substrate-binding protein
MVRLQTRYLAGLASLAVLASVVGCASASGSSGAASTPGVTSKQILVGTTQPLSGPAASYSAISAATKAYFAYVNAHGGVYGRKINYKIVDDGYDPAKTPAATRQLVLQDHVFAILNGLGTPTHASVVGFLNQNKVPDLFVGTGSLEFNNPAKYPYTFGSLPDYVIDGKVLANYVKTSLPGKKVCFLGQGDDSGADALRGVQDILGASGVASHQMYDPLTPDVAPQISAFKGAGCQVVITMAIAPFNALAMGTAAQAGLHVQWVLGSTGDDVSVLSALLKTAAGPLLSGVVGTYFMPPVRDTSNPWVALFSKINTQYNGSAPMDNLTDYGYAVGYLFVEALMKAGKDLTRQGIVQAIEKGGFTGPGYGRMRFSATDHGGFSGLQLIKFEGGQPVPIGPVYTTNDGTGPVTKVTTPPSVPPASGIPG